MQQSSREPKLGFDKSRRSDVSMMQATHESRLKVALLYGNLEPSS